MNSETVVQELKELKIEEPKDLTPKKKSKKEVVYDKLEHQRVKDREKVRGIFRFFAVPNGILRFSFRKYKGDPIEKWELRDGEVYSLPLGVALHLNENGRYPEFDYIPGMSVQTGLNADRTSPAMRVTRWIHRFAFQSLDFTNESSLNKPTKEVVTVNYI